MSINTKCKFTRKTKRCANSCLGKVHQKWRFRIVTNLLFQQKIRIYNCPNRILFGLKRSKNSYLLRNYYILAQVKMIQKMLLCKIIKNKCPHNNLDGSKKEIGQFQPRRTPLLRMRPRLKINSQSLTWMRRKCIEDKVTNSKRCSSIACPQVIWKSLCKSSTLWVHPSTKTFLSNTWVKASRRNSEPTRLELVGKSSSQIKLSSSKKSYNLICGEKTVWRL